MNALIIAAGRGSRFNNLTDAKAKPLIHLLGLSLIERVMLTAKEAGINEFVVVTGYLGDQIKEQLGDGESYGVKIDYVENEEWEKGNGVSVLKSKILSIRPVLPTAVGPNNRIIFCLSAFLFLKVLDVFSIPLDL